MSDPIEGLILQEQSVLRSVTNEQLIAELERRGFHPPSVPSSLTFAQLREVNVRRCETTWHTILHWDVARWGVAFAGEAGEVCNDIKKLCRCADDPETAARWNHGLTAQEITRNIGHEIGDTLIYADLLAARLGLSLEWCITEAFNSKSRQIGTDILLPEK
jgi:NTP pyrophosphatase (non-canonical NTP hydrolase)